jgi:hypothetical protein
MVQIQLLKRKHKHNKDSCIISNIRVNALVLAFVGKAGLGPFSTLVQILLYSDVVHLTVSFLISSFRGERTATVRDFYRNDAYARSN